MEGAGQSRSTYANAILVHRPWKCRDIAIFMAQKYR